MRFVKEAIRSSRLRLISLNFTNLTMCLVVDSGSLTLFQSRQGTTLLTPEAFGLNAISTYDSYLPLIFGKFALI